MSRDSRARLEDIIEAAEAILEFTAGASRESLAADRKTRDAVIRNLEVIGEAVKKLTPEQRARRPDVEWNRIAGLRDILGRNGDTILNPLSPPRPPTSQRLTANSRQPARPRPVPIV